MGWQTPVDVSPWTTQTASAPASTAVAQLVQIDRPPPLRLHSHDFGARTAEAVREPLAEQPVHADDHAVARLDEVRDQRVHAAGARRRHRQRRLVLGPERRPQQIRRLLDQLDEERVEVTDRRLRERVEDALRDRARARPQQDRGGGSKLTAPILRISSYHSGSVPQPFDVGPDGRAAVGVHQRDAGEPAGSPWSACRRGRCPGSRVWTIRCVKLPAAWPPVVDDRAAGVAGRAGAVQP